MFTGIVAAVGRIESVETLGEDGGLRLVVDAGTLDLSDVAIGDSIAIQGACMTAIRIDGSLFSADVSAESLSKTAGLERAGAQVNLEKALRLADRLGGHLVSGHVDGLGRVERFEPVGESWRLVIQAPGAIGKYLAYKGSITVDGVSLTVNRVRDLPKPELPGAAAPRGAELPGDPVDGSTGVEFEINLIPHTIESTTLKSLRAGDRVNLEVDLIARYVERMLSAPS